MARILICLSLFFVGCTNPDATFYSFSEASTRIITAYAAKDSACGTNRSVLSLVPGRSKRKDVDACVASIAVLSCSFWSQTGDPVPYACKAIEFRL
ncbi:LIC13255 family lipoprotein [Leptospira perolatii]|uniref:LIC13255 family lipoprotein n=1 Tax=Leptospira perolatii TaxID=2023191 RepID=UPI001FAE8E68|nr:hypothetical protein [Leptospira perolatii]